MHYLPWAKATALLRLATHPPLAHPEKSGSSAAHTARSCLSPTPGQAGLGDPQRRGPPAQVTVLLAEPFTEVLKTPTCLIPTFKLGTILVEELIG